MSGHDNMTPDMAHALLVEYEEEISRMSADLWKRQQHAEHLEDLIRWLALPYRSPVVTDKNGNPHIRYREPIFAHEDVSNMVTTHDLQLEWGHSERLSDTWRAVMGDPDPPAPGHWQRCPSCYSWYVHAIVEPESEPAASFIRTAP